MGKRKLVIGMIAGAVAGGLATLVDSETRHYTKEKFVTAKEKTGIIVSNPSQAVQEARFAINRMNDSVSGTIAKAINTLDQVEGSLDRVTSKVKQIDE